VNITSESLNINLLEDLTHPGGRRKSEVNSRRITKSLFNIPLASTECHVSHTGNGNEKQIRYFGGIKTNHKKASLVDTNEKFRRLRPWKILLNFLSNPIDIFKHQSYI
jgi:hypothetical protein